MDWRFALGFFCGAAGIAASQFVRPAHLVGIHQALFRAFWRWKSRRCGGRPRICPELVELIRRMARENPRWGAPRIHGELLKLGWRVAQSTVSKYIALRPRSGNQSWKIFLRNHRDEIAAIDVFTLRTLTFECLYALVVLGHARRKIIHIEVAGHATAQWLANQITEAFP